MVRKSEGSRRPRGTRSCGCSGSRRPRLLCVSALVHDTCIDRASLPVRNVCQYIIEGLPHWSAGSLRSTSAETWQKLGWGSYAAAVTGDDGAYRAAAMNLGLSIPVHPNRPAVRLQGERAKNVARLIAPRMRLLILRQKQKRSALSASSRTRFALGSRATTSCSSPLSCVGRGDFMRQKKRTMSVFFHCCVGDRSS